jgi:predicted SprT family Zn-dependent metalloprotease
LSVVPPKVFDVDLRDAFALAEDLLEHHGLTDWTVVYDSAKKRAGICRFGPQVLGLSAPLTVLHSEHDVRDTILHEIAHALAGPQHGHDEVWRETAVRIGCSGERCVSPDSPRIEPPWLGACPAGHSSGRHRRPERVVTCGECNPVFDLANVFSWTHHGRPAVMHPNYEVELDRLRSGRRMTLHGVGTRLRITAAGEFEGRVGKVVKLGRTSYHLRAGRTTVRVPFALVERV